jgi:hypothetical protein
MAGTPKSKRSGGPKTAMGKQVASHNSLKTGIYSNVIVLPGESESEFQQLEAQFIKDFSPQDIAELTMVRELAVVVWKKHRLERLELSASLKVLNQRIEDSDYRRHGLTIRTSARFWVDNLDYLTDEVVAWHEQVAEEAELFLNRELFVADIESMMLMYPSLYKSVLVLAEKHGFFPEEAPSAAQLVALHISNAKSDSVPFVSCAIEQAAEVAEDILWAHEHAAKIKAAATSIHSQRLLGIMELEMPRRVNDDLSRIFFRTLSELRKHQQWRQARNTVDITPKPTTQAKA